MDDQDSKEVNADSKDGIVIEDVKNSTVNDDSKNSEVNEDKDEIMTNTTILTTSTDKYIDTSLEPSIYCKFQANGYDCSEVGKFQTKFYYDLKMEDCIPTKVGTCEHNLNVFNTVKSCRRECQSSGLSVIVGELPPEMYCRMQPDFGKCNSYHPMWYYDVTERVCKGFSFSGCGGNMNRFHTRKSCSVACASQTDFENERK